MGYYPRGSCGEGQTGGDELDIPFAFLIAACGRNMEDFKKDHRSHEGPPDCILLCCIRELILKEVGFRYILKKVMVMSSALQRSRLRRHFQETSNFERATKGQAMRAKEHSCGDASGRTVMPVQMVEPRPARC
ncbi:hypothetical protein CTI12_AA524980 [Artemisia annua]|uniref:Uncharacterized protein n=1 Tax=Artemisia annua TaxID=35608 RepID=A0A2U1L6D5_ARTAN|nr:hypothetical protein CTI12_AA524980 [Artemisia annua]